MTPLQQKLEKLGKTLAIAALAICVVIFAAGMLYNKPFFEMFLTSVSLAVAAIPEGLPAIATIVLALSVQRMAKLNAIVRTLPSVETLGSATVICSDKTGTLTMNQMEVLKLYVNGGNLCARGGSERRIKRCCSTTARCATTPGSAARTEGKPLWVIPRRLRSSTWQSVWVTIRAIWRSRAPGWRSCPLTPIGS